MVMVAHRRGGKIAWADPGVKQRNIISISKPRTGHHPNEKPVELVARFIELHTKPGDTVLDPFCGSGTTGVACMQTGRKFIGCEIDEKYVEIARRRIAEAVPLEVVT